MSEFYDTLTKILTTKQMSISSIARELKKNGYDQHRLILTGYLRALQETGFLEEIDVPPSKVYVAKNGMNRNIYSLLKEHLKDIDNSEKFEMGVFILTSVFHRPCFKHELELSGIEARRSDIIKESRDARLKEHRNSITRIKIPPEDPAYEISGDINRIQLRGSKVLINMLGDLIDLEGLKAKFQQTKLT